MTRVFALTTRSLEAVSADEMGAVPGVQVKEVAYRRVAATCEAPLALLLGLRTVDDVFLDVGTWSGITRQRSTLTRLGKLSAKLGLHEAVAHCAEFRPIPRSPAFSITANFVGKRNYSTDDIKQACAEGIAQCTGWTYVPDDAEADLNVRVFIEHERAFVGLRLGEAPLHRRFYKQAHVPGSLKPSVAAALLALAEVPPGMHVLDPCCGAGTILIEAALGGALAQGGDRDPGAVAAARVNAVAAGVVIGLQEWDAQALPLDDGSIDRIVTNLPWGREVQVDAALGSFYRLACSEMRRVLAPGGRIVVLSNLPHQVDLPGLCCDTQIEISLFGQTPMVLVFS
jgi:23S rRNA G2445 N2-methylase RlmL